MTRISSLTRQRAKKLRRAMTPPERMVWRKLQQIRGWHFRRQAPVGPYIADFVCFRKKLVVELDGETHAGASAAARDKRRDAWFRAQGFQVFRVSNRDVMEDIEAVIETILTRLMDTGEHVSAGGAHDRV